LSKHHEAGKGDTQRPTDLKSYEEGWDRIFKQKLSQADLAEYELDKSTGEITKVAK